MTQLHTCEGCGDKVKEVSATVTTPNTLPFSLTGRPGGNEIVKKLCTPYVVKNAQTLFNGKLLRRPDSKG